MTIYATIPNGFGIVAYSLCVGGLPVLFELRDCPQAFPDMIGDQERFQAIVDNQFAVKINLVCKLAANPVGIHLVGFSCDSHIKRADMPIITERGYYGKHGHWFVVKGRIGYNLAHFFSMDKIMWWIPSVLSSI
jgi:hypothetical protein